MILRRFAREGRVLAKVQHANIAHLLDAGVAAGQPYLILEYVRGESIDLYCEAHDIAVLLSGMGEIRQALAASESVNRHLDERDSVVYTLSYAALLMRMGDPAAALRALDGVVDRARASGNQVSLLYALLKAGAIFTQLGRWDDAESALREASLLLDAGIGERRGRASLETAGMALELARGSDTSADVGEALLLMARARLSADASSERDAVDLRSMLERAVRCLSNGLRADHALHSRGLGALGQSPLTSSRT